MKKSQKTAVFWSRYCTKPAQHPGGLRYYGVRLTWTGDAAHLP